ncbi:MAG: hypothetical protein M3Q42_00355 [Pseudomonadota bacterium]|nr:hypothetical protein [Pseudomonadota bacterium]
MSSDITVQTVRLALGMNELQARVASVNIANAGKTGAGEMRVDFGSLQSILASATSSTADTGVAERLRAAAAGLANSAPFDTGAPINADEQIGDMVAASINYQALGEALSRHMGLMRLAATGRN